MICQCEQTQVGEPMDVVSKGWYSMEHMDHLLRALPCGGSSAYVQKGKGAKAKGQGSWTLGRMNVPLDTDDRRW